MPGGRPKVTLKDLPKNWKEGMLEIAKNGGSDVKIRGFLNCISHETFVRLQKDNPEFLETVSRCHILCQIWWEETGQSGIFMGGKDNPFNGNVWGLNMKNRFGWGEKTTVDQNTKSTLTVKHEVVDRGSDNATD